MEGWAALVDRASPSMNSCRILKSGAVPSKLSRPECGTVAGIVIPPDVRLAGDALRERAHLGSPSVNRQERRFHLMIEQSRPLTRTHRAIASALERPATRKA